MNSGNKIKKRVSVAQKPLKGLQYGDIKKIGIMLNITPDHVRKILAGKRTDTRGVATLATKIVEKNNSRLQQAIEQI